MKYGYIRNSLNNQQSLEKQRQAIIEKAGADTVIIEESNGKEQRDIMLEKLQNGDSLYIVSEERLVKTMDDNKKIEEMLKEKNISLFVTKRMKEDAE